MITITIIATSILLLKIFINSMKALINCKLFLGIIVGHLVLIGNDTHTLTLNVPSIRSLSQQF